MKILQCSSCGIQMEDTGNNLVCPMCGGNMISPEAKISAMPKVENVPEEIDNSPFIPEIERAKMYEWASPAMADDNNLEYIREPLKKYLEKRTANYPKEIFTVLWEPLSYAIDRAIQSRAARANEQAEKLIRAANAYFSAGQDEQPGLGFSLITNNAVDAAAYTGLTALDFKARQGRAELSAAEDLHKTLQSIQSSANSYAKIVLEAIDKAVADFDYLQQNKERISAYEEFYEDASNDIGILVAGVNVFHVLSAAGHGICGFLGDVKVPALGIGKSPKQRKSALFQLDGAGYIKVLDYSYQKKSEYSSSRYEKIDVFYYISTGKYEEAILSRKDTKSDQKSSINTERMMAEEYEKAEAALSIGQYYEAATAFARLEGYRDAIQRSMRIWQKYLLIEHRGHIFWDEEAQHAVCSNGSVVFGDSKNEPWFSLKAAQWRDTCEFHRVCWNNITGYIILTFSGKLTYWTKDPSKQSEFKEYCSRWNQQVGIPIVGLYVTYRFCIVVYKNGVVRCFGPDAHKYEKEISQLTDIKETSVGSAFVFIKRDRTVCAIASKATYSHQLSTWRNIKKVWVGREVILGLTYDGKIRVAGERAEEFQDQINGDDFVDIYEDDDHGMLGLTSSGRIIAFDSEKTPAQLWCSALHGVKEVKTNYKEKFMALKLDGTVVAYGINTDFSHWNNIVSIDIYRDTCYAIRADGTILVATTDNSAVEQNNISQWKIFNHINTYRKERESAINENETNPSRASSEVRGCYVATAVYGSYDCPQVWTLRRFRDYTLAKTWYGRAFIHTYYAISPTLVKWFGHTEWFKKMWKGKLDRMVANLNAEGVEDTPYEDKTW